MMTGEVQERIRKEFSHIDTLYFNSAYFGPSPYIAKQKVANAMFKELDPSFYAYNAWMGIPDKIRKSLAKLIKTNPNNIALQSSSSDIISIVANGFDFGSNGAAAFMKGDYPSDALPWLLAKENRGIEVHTLEHALPTAQWLEKNLPSNTKVFNISHVTFDTGKKIDLKEIGKLMQERGILFVVDATQSLGGMAISEEELSYIDVLSCSCYKWLLGPYGSAFGYFSPRAQKLIKHRVGNWIASINSKNVYNLLDYTTKTLPGARKFDRGQAPNMLVNACLEASLDLIDYIGLETIQEFNAGLRDHFLENFPRKKYELITPETHMGNIICIKSNNIDSVKLERELKHNLIDVSVRQGNIRLSFHFFNTIEQVNTLIDTLDL